MSNFIIRDDRGVLKAKVDARLMAAITSRGGKWRPYNETVCYEYEEDMQFDLGPFGIGLRIMLWAGDKVIPTTE